MHTTIKTSLLGMQFRSDRAGMFRTLITFSILLVCISGCAPPKSLESLVVDSKVIFEDRLVGNWLLEADKNSGKMIISKSGEKSYSIVTEEKDSGTTPKLDAFLMAVDKRKYLDLSRKLKSGTTVHTFVRITFEGRDRFGIDFPVIGKLSEKFGKLKTTVVRNDDGTTEEVLADSTVDLWKWYLLAGQMDCYGKKYYFCRQ
ncbi:MAG: hypothetical protein PHQ23_03510 [Candidatus Wallbacteria bacterium]|nr:hypothetical protein [Candidatus Wallbacteria bacterium]